MGIDDYAEVYGGGYNDEYEIPDGSPVPADSPPTEEPFGSTPASVGCTCESPPTAWMYEGWHHDRACGIYSPPASDSMLATR